MRTKMAKRGTKPGRTGRKGSENAGFCSRKRKLSHWNVDSERNATSLLRNANNLLNKFTSPRLKSRSGSKITGKHVALHGVWTGFHFGKVELFF